MPIKLRLVPGRVEKACFLGLWVLVLVCLLGEAVYLVVTGFRNPRGTHISNFDTCVADWNSTNRAAFSHLKVLAGNAEFAVLLPYDTEVYPHDPDAEATWYSPLYYSGMLNQSHISVSSFDSDVNLTLQLTVQSPTSNDSFTILPVPTVRILKEHVTEQTCNRHSGYHDPIFGWCIVFLRLQRVCIIVTERSGTWSAEGGCAGASMDQLADYQSMQVRDGSQTPDLPVTTPEVTVTVRSSRDPVFAAVRETSGSFDFGVKDTVYKVLGVILLSVTLVLLIHPICYFRRRYRDWQRSQHRQFEDARGSKTPPMEEASF